MPFVKLNTIEGKEIIPGFKAVFTHTDHMTCAYWTVEEGAVLPEHEHHYEQITNLIEGTFEMTVDGVTKVCEAGEAAVIPAHIVHSGKALTSCRIIDAFYPVREDFNNT